jgi:hypothetical protein
VTQGVGPEFKPQCCKRKNKQPTKKVRELAQQKEQIKALLKNL